MFRSMGYYGTHLRTLIWELSFAKMLFSIFFLENASQIGFRIPGVTAPRTYQRQRSQNPASGNERLSKPGVQGRSPGPLSPHFSGEMGTPRRAGGAPGALRLKVASAPPTQRVRSPVPPLAGGSVRTAAGSHLQGGFPPGPGRGSRLSLGESPDTKSRGGGPPPPFDGPLATARSFWGWVPHCSGRWAITVPIYVP